MASHRFALNSSVVLRVAADAPAPLRLAAEHLCGDIRAVSGGRFAPTVGEDAPDSDAIRIAVSPELFPADARESYRVRSLPGNLLRIDGCDMRGAIYGIYEFSRRCLGIRPEYRWDPCPPAPRPDPELAWDHVDLAAGTPKFRYRGIFINDEDLLTGWRKGETRDIDYPFYRTVIARQTAEMIAETAMRMGYNLAIPASFVDIRDPHEEMLPEVFSRHGMILSMHHVEPLGVSAFGFDNYWRRRGEIREYSYFTDPEALREVWRDSIRRWAKYPEVIWQLGLRGRGDRPFWTGAAAPETDEARAALIAGAIREQYELVREITGDPDALFSTTLWGEGSLFNRRGLLPIPPGVIKVFSDNCAGWRMQEDFAASPVLPEEHYGLYCHHAIILGTHLAQAIGARDFHAVLKDAAQLRPLDYAVFNVANVREFVYGMTATAAIARDPETFSPETFLHEWVAERFSRRRDDIRECYRRYFAAFEKNPRGVAFYNDGVLLFEVNRAVERFRNAASWRDSLDPTFRESLRDMFPQPVDPAEKLAVLDRMRNTLADVHAAALAIRDALPERERPFFHAQLVHPSGLCRRFADAAAAMLRGESAFRKGDRAAAAGHITDARDALRKVESSLPDYLAGPFADWYADCRKIDFRKTLRRLEELGETISPA